MPRPASSSATTSGGGVTAAAMGVMTLATYGYTIVTARVVGPHGYGEFTAVVNVLFVLSVAALGLQTTAARLVTTSPGQVDRIERAVVRISVRLSAYLMLGLLLLSPLVQIALQLSSWWLACLIALSAFPLTLVGGYVGVLQGERRWRHLAMVYLATGIPRLAVGTALLLIRPSAAAAIIGMFIGMWAPVMLGAWLLRHPRTSTDTGAQVEGSVVRARAVLRESLGNTQTLVAFLALSSLDIVVARNVLSEHGSGLYGAGLILTRAVFVIPQVLVVVAFPDFAHPTARARALRRSLIVVLAAGALLTLATYLAPDLALVFAGGSEFSGVRDQLWLFTLLGTVLSLIQLLIYAGLAQQEGTVIGVWVALATLIGVGLSTDSLTGLITVALVVDTALLAVLGAVTWYRIRSLGRTARARAYSAA